VVIDAFCIVAPILVRTEMLKRLDDRIYSRVKRFKRGTLFFMRDSLEYGKSETVRKAFYRLTKAGKLRKRCAGIYYRPRKDSIFGPLTPGVDEVVKIIAKRKGFRVAPTGYHALNKLGLSTKVVANYIYLTDGNTRRLKIGKTTVNFIRTSTKNVSAKGDISHLAIQALRIIGKGSITEKEIRRIQHVLTFEHQENLKHDIKLAPIWIQKIIQPAIR